MMVDLGRRRGSAAFRLSLVMSGALLAPPAGLFIAASAQAQTRAERSYDIPAQPLAGALRQYMQQSGVQVGYPSDIGVDVTSTSVKGAFGTADALGRLLAGTGLTYRFTGSGTATLERTPQAAENAILLGTLRVEGAVAATTGSSSLGSAAEGMDADPFAIYRTPRPIAVVNRDKLDRIPQTTPSDMFNAIPGVQMANAASGASFDPNIRGAQGHGRVKVLLDGTDSSQASRVSYAGNRQHNYVDPDFIAGIAVEKGPGLESGGMGGTINMRTFNASDIITDPNRNWGIRVRGMLGDNSGTLNSTQICQTTLISTGVTTNVGPPNNSTAPLCLSGGSTTRRTYQMVPYDTGVDVPGTNWSGSVIGAWRPAEFVELVAGYSRRQNGNYTAGKNGTVDPSYPTNGGYYFDATPKDSFSYWKPGQEIYGTFTDTESYMAKARFSFGDHGLMLKFNNFESRYVQHANTASQISADVINYYPPASNTQQQRYGAEYAWQPSSDWLSIKADIWTADTREELYLGEFGGSLTPQNIQTDTLGFGFSNTSSIPLFARVATLKIGGNYKGEDTESDTEVNGLEVEQFGVFASLTFPVLDWLTLDGGLRYDDYKATIDPNQTYRFARDNSDNGTSLQGGITIQPADPLQLFFRYAEGWRAPSTRENTLNNCNGGAEPYQSGTNTYYRCIQGLMKPERSETIEFGANLSFTNLVLGGDRLGVKVTRFDNKLIDYIYGSGTSVLPLMNIDSARFIGYEVSVSYDAGWVFADYGYTNNDRVEFCGTSYPTSTNPSVGCARTTGWGDLFSQYAPARHRHNATLGVRLFDRKLTIGGSGTFVRGTGWDYDGMRRYDIYDLFASYAFGPVEFALSAENIGDRYYFEAGTGAAWPLPAAGRMVRGTLTFKY